MIAARTARYAALIGLVASTMSIGAAHAVPSPAVPSTPTSVVEIQVAGRAGVPSNAPAVAVQLTVARPTANGYVTAYPCGSARPTASNLNFRQGETRSNPAIVRLGSGKLCVYTSVRADVVVDVSGWFPTEQALATITPTRVLDTRSGLGGASRLSGGQTVRVPVAGANGVNSAASTVAMNVTAVNPSGTGSVTVHACEAAVPDEPTVTFTSGMTVANLTMVALAGRDVCVSASTATDVVLDVGGWGNDASLFNPTSTIRVVDTSRGLGGSRLGAGQTATVTMPGAANGSAAATVNIAAIGAASNGYMTVYPCGAARPTASNVNIKAGVTVSALALSKMDASSRICVYTSTATDLTVDFTGWFEQGSGYTPMVPVRLIDTRLEFPSAANVGVPAGTGLRGWPWALRTSAANVPTESRNGMTCKVFDGYNVAMSGGQFLSVDSPCVIFRRSRFSTSGSVSNGSAIVQQMVGNSYLEVTQSDFDGGPYHMRGLQGDQADMFVSMCEFTRFGQAAVEMNNRNATASLTVEESYFYEPKGWNRSDHVDGIQVGGARNITIRHNTILIEPFGGTNGDTSYVSNSALGLWAELGNVSGTVIVDANLLAGGGRTIYIEQKSPYRWMGPVLITNNVFDMRFGPNASVWGPLYPTGLPAQLTWSGNVFSNGASLSLQQALTLYP